MALQRRLCCYPYINWDSLPVDHSMHCVAISMQEEPFGQNKFIFQQIRKSINNWYLSQGWRYSFLHSWLGVHLMMMIMPIDCTIRILWTVVQYIWVMIHIWEIYYAPLQINWPEGVRYWIMARPFNLSIWCPSGILNYWYHNCSRMTNYIS